MWHRDVVMAVVFFGTLLLVQEGDLQTLRLIGLFAAFAFVALLAVYWSFKDRNPK